MDNILKEYEIKNKIGEGQFGEVYKILNIKDNKYYAMKKMDKDNNEYESVERELENMKILKAEIQLNLLNVLKIKIVII